MADVSANQYRVVNLGTALDGSQDQLLGVLTGTAVGNYTLLGLVAPSSSDSVGGKCLEATTFCCLQHFSCKHAFFKLSGHDARVAMAVKHADDTCRCGNNPVLLGNNRSCCLAVPCSRKMCAAEIMCYLQADCLPRQEVTLSLAHTTFPDYTLHLLP